MRESIRALRCDILCLKDTGKPVQICILSCSLAFHAITFERSSYTKIAFFNEASVATNQLVSLFCYLVARIVAENVVTDRLTD